MKKFKLNKKETIRYILAGTLSAGANLSVFFAMKNILGVNYLISNLTAWSVTVIVGYLGDKFFVFKTSFEYNMTMVKEFLRFLYGRIFSGIADMILLWVLVDMLRMNSDIAKFLNSGIVVTINYIICKLLVFKA